MRNVLFCKNCLNEIEYPLISISTIVKCPNCGKEYIVVKNRMFMIFEIFFLFICAIYSKSFLESFGIDLHIIFELIIVFAILVIINFLFDYFFLKVVKKHNYFVLVERLENAPARKKENRK